MFVIQRLTADQTRPLRQLVLRPHQPAEVLVYPGDDDPDSLHVGALLDGVIITVASVMRNPPPDKFLRPDDDQRDCWQLRGMATHPDYRSQGSGGQVLQAIIGHAAAKGGSLLWCNGRTPAVAFYERHGFTTRGDEHFVPNIGPHYFMILPLHPDDAARLAALTPPSER